MTNKCFIPLSSIYLVITIEVIVCNLLILNSYLYKAISSFPIQTNYQLYPFELHLWRKQNSFCYNKEWCNHCLVHAFILDNFSHRNKFLARSLPIPVIDEYGNKNNRVFVGVLNRQKKTLWWIEIQSQEDWIAPSVKWMEMQNKRWHHMKDAILCTFQRVHNLHKFLLQFKT